MNFDHSINDNTPKLGRRRYSNREPSDEFKLTIGLLASPHDEYEQQPPLPHPTTTRRRSVGASESPHHTEEIICENTRNPFDPQLALDAVGVGVGVGKKKKKKQLQEDSSLDDLIEEKMMERIIRNNQRRQQQAEAGRGRKIPVLAASKLDVPSNIVWSRSNNLHQEEHYNQGSSEKEARTQKNRRRKSKSKSMSIAGTRERQSIRRTSGTTGSCCGDARRRLDRHLNRCSSLGYNEIDSRRNKSNVLSSTSDYASSTRRATLSPDVVTVADTGITPSSSGTLQRRKRVERSRSHLSLRSVDINHENGNKDTGNIRSNAPPQTASSDQRHHRRQQRRLVQRSRSMGLSANNRRSAVKDTDSVVSSNMERMGKAGDAGNGQRLQRCSTSIGFGLACTTNPSCPCPPTDWNLLKRVNTAPALNSLRHDRRVVEERRSSGSRNNHVWKSRRTSSGPKRQHHQRSLQPAPPQEPFGMCGMSASERLPDCCGGRSRRHDFTSSRPSEEMRMDSLDSGGMISEIQSDNAPSSYQWKFYASWKLEDNNCC